MTHVKNEPGTVMETLAQDPTNPKMIVKFNQVQQSTTLGVATVVGESTCTVADATGFVTGQYLILYSGVTNRYHVSYITDVTLLVITVDTPFDSVLPIGASADGAITDMSVNGSVTPQVFGVRGADTAGAVSATIDITRIIFSCLTASAVNLAKFADITKLAKGLVLRKRDGTYYNIFNVKSNGEIDGVTMDWIPYLATNPSSGQDGFTARLTFSGVDKLGAVERLAPNEDLEFIIQDDLSGITLLEVVAEGHVVED